MRMRRALVLTLGFLVLAGCGGSQAAAPSAPTTSATAAATAPATAKTTARPSASWSTYGGSLRRTGAAAAGPALGRAKRLWSAPTGAAVYAQPLVSGGRVIVASENDDVLALSASSGRREWGTHLGTPVDGSSLPCGNIDPSGITATPAIDRGAQLVYTLAFLAGPRHVLFGLDLHSGAIKSQRSADPPGADPSVQQERAALALANGRVYVAYGGLLGDCGAYHGWVLGVPPTGAIAAYKVPTAREAGIWAPPGPSVDAAGNVFVATGNGASSTTFDYGNAVIKLSPSLRVKAHFAQPGAPGLGAQDLDLGSTSPILLPGGRAFIIGKGGPGYLLDAGRLGKALSSVAICQGGAFGGSAYAHGVIYVPCSNGVTAVRVSGHRMNVLWRQPAATQSPTVAGPGVWTIGGSTLYQLDRRNGHIRFRADIGSATRFTSPAAAGGRIYVAAGGRVYAYG
jgi:outer membrane protein assembly factor BamB